MGWYNLDIVCTYINIYIYPYIEIYIWYWISAGLQYPCRKNKLCYNHQAYNIPHPLSLQVDIGFFYFVFFFFSSFYFLGFSYLLECVLFFHLCHSSIAKHSRICSAWQTGWMERSIIFVLCIKMRVWERPSRKFQRNHS